MPGLLPAVHISIDKPLEVRWSYPTITSLPRSLVTHEREQGSLPYTPVCRRFSNIDLVWAAQGDQIPISSRAEATTILGKRTRCPQRCSDLANMHNNSEKVQYVPR